jgi:hypothetical protein
MIRTKEALTDALAAELVWRRKELSGLKRLATTASSTSERRALFRAGIALLYAHFEGFVHISGRYYLEYVSMQRLPNDELCDSLLAIIVQTRLAGISGSRKASAFSDLVSFFREDSRTRARFPYKTAISTESNLSSVVLREILWCLNFDYRPYETKEKLIDSRLLARRNHVAHGKDVYVDEEDYVNLHDEVIGILALFRNQIETAAFSGSFKR